VATGGGFLAPDTTPGDVEVLGSFPTNSETGVVNPGEIANGWDVNLLDNGANPVTVDMYVICVNAP
jgi:hypothetical protein